MQQPPADFWLYAMMIAMPTVSIATWAALTVRWWRGQPLLTYEPRTPVPWGALVAMFAVVMVVVALVAAIGADAADKPEEIPHPLDIAERIVSMILFQSAVTAGILYFVSVKYRPSLSDLGLPIYADELARDVKIGVVAFLAAIAPVYAAQIVIFYVFGPSEHPLIKMVTIGGPNIGILFLASVAAVVIAPICEEVLFRLLLQGWLEKSEDRQVRISDDGTPDESTIQAWNTDWKDSTQPLITSRAAERGLLGLPYGYFSVLVSSLLFALAHFGHGPDPIAIFILALVLGFVYHRTHRIVPCIVAHALFNSLTMLLLWRVVFLHVE